MKIAIYHIVFELIFDPYGQLGSYVIANSHKSLNTLYGFSFNRVRDLYI